MTDEELMARLRAGDRRAMEVLIDRYGKLVYGKAFALVQNHTETEDIVQNVFIRAFKYSGGFNGKSLKGWLSKITYNCSIDAIRKAVRSENVILNCKNSVLPEIAEEKREFSDLIAPLPSQDKEIITLKYLFELPYKEISQLTGKSEGTLRNIVWKALKTLREGCRS